MTVEDFSAERMAEHVVNYMSEGYTGSARHVRRVAAWLGFLTLGIDKIKDNWHDSNGRQLIFEKDGQRYKVRYNHGVRPNGGVEIVEVTPGRGSARRRGSCSDREPVRCGSFYDKPQLRRPAKPKNAA